MFGQIAKVGSGLMVFLVPILIWANHSYQERKENQRLSQVREQVKKAQPQLLEKQLAAKDRWNRLGAKEIAALDAARRVWPTTYLDSIDALTPDDPWVKYSAPSLDSYLPTDLRVKYAEEDSRHQGSNISVVARVLKGETQSANSYARYQANKCLASHLCANALAANSTTANLALAGFNELAAHLSDSANDKARAEICGIQALTYRNLAYLGYPGVSLSKSVEMAEFCAALPGYSQAQYYFGTPLTDQVGYARKALAAYADARNQ